MLCGFALPSDKQQFNDICSGQENMPQVGSRNKQSNLI